MHPSRSLQVGYEAALGHSGTILLKLGGDVSGFFLVIVITCEKLAASFR